MSRPRVAVVGGGHLGNYHLQKLAKDPDAQLVAVVDIDPAKRERHARTHGIAAVAALAELAGLADAVVIATPTTSHHELGMAALELGLHVLVEKPITATVAQARELTARARERGLVLQVGHTERWNPAIAAALAVVDKPGYLVAERLAPFTGRSTDVDVILDLMIHDLDIAASLIPSALKEVRAVGVPVITTQVDMCAARLEFEDGTVAQVSAGRASMEPIRKIRLFTPERYVSIDCATREVKSVRRLAPEPGSNWPQLTGEPIEVPEGDALQNQDHDFVRCVIEARRPRVDGEAGTRALELAEAVKAAMSVPMACTPRLGSP